MFLYRIFALSISMDVIGSALVSQTVQYETLNKAPDSSSLIGSISSTCIIEMCLIRCSNKVHCKSVVYEDSKCRLYNTTNDSSVLTTGQRAVSLIRRKSSYANIIWRNTVQLKDFMSCRVSSAAEGYVCHKMIDGDLTTSWMTTTNKLGQWIRLDFSKSYEIHTIDLWSNNVIPGQCRNMRFTFNDDVTIQVERNCGVDGGKPTYNRFEIGGVVSNYVIMTCTVRCYPPGWYSHFEIVIFVRR
ncbi:hypothetical protein LSH36_440g02039 [Paralvinella palmiformis]|uniref:F5/8 type C domain-containing protein n=1 Tax=Paralvinella palmiformis TaxID=53620 RepID=A0AAD9MZC0_9ANNE|nr:hypothetical protein LSH36_440g02039 [Paralvinella palmiformis]